MKKWVVLLLIMIVFCLCGCSKDTGVSSLSEYEMVEIDKRQEKSVFGI